MRQAEDRASERLDRPDHVEDESTRPAASDFAIPLLSEELDVQKYIVDKATVRITKTIHERPETISELLTSEQIEVERVPKDQIIDSPPSMRMEGQVMIIPVVEEIVVVTKQLRLKEELRVTKKQIVTEYRQDVTLRSQEVTIERSEKTAAPD